MNVVQRLLLSFCGGWGGFCKVILMSTPTTVLRLCYVLWLGLWQFQFKLNLTGPELGNIFPQRRSLKNKRTNSNIYRSKKNMLWALMLSQQLPHALPTDESLSLSFIVSDYIDTFHRPSRQQPDTYTFRQLPDTFQAPSRHPPIRANKTPSIHLPDTLLALSRHPLYTI